MKKLELYGRHTTFDYNADKWGLIDTEDYFKNKKVVLFNSLSILDYENNIEDFKKQNIDEIYCISLETSFPLPKDIKIILDSTGSFTKKVSDIVGRQLVNYSMIINDSIIEKVFEEPGNSANTVLLWLEK